MSFLLRTSRIALSISLPRLTTTQISLQARHASTILDSATISKITEKEKEITGQDGPVKGGPTTFAQKHVGEQLNAQNIAEITKGEKKITAEDQPVKDGPTSVAQRAVSGNRTTGGNTSASVASNSQAANARNSNTASGVLNSATISKITDAEKKITGQDQPITGGPTSAAQRHAGEEITSEALKDITAGEKKIADGERVKGGPTSTAQSELGRSRN